MHIAWQLAFGAALFVVGGWWLDSKGGTHFWIVAGTLTGMVYCGFIVWRVIRDVTSDED